MSLPPAPANWKVLPHSGLESVGENAWRITGALPNMALPRTAFIARRADGDLLVHSAIAVDDATLAQICALGRPRYLMVPNAFHRLDAPAWKARFPDMRVICPAAARKAAEEKVPVDAVIEELGGEFDAASGVTLVSVPGVSGKEAVVRVAGSTGSTLGFCDLLFNLPHQAGFMGWVFKTLGSTGGPRVTKIARWTMVKDAPALGAFLRSQAESGALTALVPGHGDLIANNPGQILGEIGRELGA
jgi:hypothetical protein